MQGQHKGFSVTTLSEKSLAYDICRSIDSYWHERGYDIRVWVGQPKKNTEKNIKENKHRIPIFPIRSNVGLKGYPPG
jgi:hypothetical protein